jgi:hypothetical protein
MAVPSFVGVLGRSPEDLPSGRPQVRDRHLKFHEERDNLVPLAEFGKVYPIGSNYTATRDAYIDFIW